jgi:hypothetical protein
MRLIDADALIDEMQHHLDSTYMSVCSSVEECKARRYEIQYCIDRIEQAGEISAAPVVRGEWIEHEDEMECPQCGYFWNYCDNDTERFNYCPNCGAKMEGNPCG